VATGKAGRLKAIGRQSKIVTENKMDEKRVIRAAKRDKNGKQRYGQKLGRK